MVVGSGLLAQAFQMFSKDDSFIIFASGVSNSGEKSDAAYERELNLLDKHMQKGRCLIYFSTVSIHDPDLQTSRYVQHKLSIEKKISACGSEFMIFRLPIVVGYTSNPFTLTNFLYNKISSGQKIEVFNKACRYLMDIGDVAHSLSLAIKSRKPLQEIWDVNYNNSVFIDDLITVYEKVLQKKAKRSYIDKGGCYQTYNKKYISFLQENIETELITDPYTIIQKYYSR